MAFGSGPFGSGAFGGFTAGPGIAGQFPNPLTLPEDSLILKINLTSIFDVGMPEVDKEADLQEIIADIEYHSMYTVEHEFQSTVAGYTIDDKDGLYGAYPVYIPVPTYETVSGVQGYLVALLLVCEKGSCVTLNNSMSPPGGPVESTQFLPLPMTEGDFMLWADETLPLIGEDEDGAANAALGLLGVQATTDNGARIRVHAFYKFVEFP
jgi:hypothetical protein